MTVSTSPEKPHVSKSTGTSLDLPHLPPPPVDRLKYSHICSLQELYDGPRPIFPQEFRSVIAIIPGASAEAVYQSLPSSADRVFTGCLTEAAIRFAVGRSYTPVDSIQASCTFHSHSIRDRQADQPSEAQVFTFLSRSPLRHITVGRQWLWYWDKSGNALDAARRLTNWVWDSPDGKPRSRGQRAFPAAYISSGLAAIGLKQPLGRYRDPQSWTKLLEDSLGIQTHLIRHKPR
jgi:hypothetical protein